MATIATSSITVLERTVQGNKRVHYCSYIPTTAAGSDTVNVGLQVVDFVTGNWGGTTAVNAACVVSFAATTAGVVVTNTTHANHPVNFVAVGR